MNVILVHCGMRSCVFCLFFLVAVHHGQKIDRPHAADVVYGDVSFGGSVESFNKAVPRKEGYPPLGGTLPWPRKGSSGHGFGRELRDPI